MDKRKYLICLDYPTEFTAREFITKPMTEEEFDTDIRGCIREGLFPIIVEGNRKEADIWDNLILTEAIINNPNIFITMGVKYA